jgi:Zn-finger nucleic acid-binding protein
MEAATLNCPMCGAPSASDATQCEHCGAKLATVACPSCLGMIFLGSKFCQHCGAKIERTEENDAKPKQCPRCRIDLAAVALGSTKVHECTKCEGLWVDVATFNEICADREKQAAVLGGASPAPAPTSLDFNLDDVRYVPCPECATLMNRVNFSGHSGVIVDVCKGHGTWFDRDELRRIVEFIRAGGLEIARDRDRAEWESEKRLHNFLPSGDGIGTPIADGSFSRNWSTGYDVADALVTLGGVLARLLKK